jgi:hypothetical protein
MRLGRRKPATTRLRQRHSGSDESMPKNSASSYRARRSDEEPNLGRRTERKNNRVSPALHSGRFWIQRFGLIILLVAVVASAVNILNLSTTAEILPVTSDGSTPLLFDKAAYQAAANHLLAESVWNRNKVTVDTGQISRQLLAQFPELASVGVTIPLLAHQPIVYIEPAQPALMIQSASSGSFVINANGKAVLATTHNPPVAGQPALPVLTDLSGLKLTLGHQVLPANTVSFVQTVVAQLSAKKYTVSSMTLPPAASELDVALTGKPYSIKFNLENNDARRQVGTFLATMSELQSQNITPAHYVDVRVDGRAYYQ